MYDLNFDFDGVDNLIKFLKFIIYEFTIFFDRLVY